MCRSPERALIVFVLCSISCCVHCDNNTNGEVYLHKMLFESYNPDILPVLNKSKPITVGLKMYLMSIDNIDEKRQTIAERAFLEIKWTDAFLVWDPEEFGGVSKINVQNKNIWIPDISLDDTFHSPTDLGQEGGRANVYSDGTVIIWPYKVYTVSCKIYIGKFPFDEQNCEFDFLSWTNPASVLVLSTPSFKMDTFYYTESGEWDLTNAVIYQFQRPYGNDLWDHILYKLQIRRKWLFQALNMIAPIVCISLLNVFCFLLPARSGERVTLCISIFLTLAVFLTIVNSSMPESSDEVALFGVYVGMQLVGSALAIAMTVVSIYLFDKETFEPVPRLFRLIANMCCTVPHVPEEKTPVDNNGFLNDPDTKLTNGNDKNFDVPTQQIQVIKSQDAEVTWVMVSSALDRVCFIAALCWHVVLACMLFIGTTA